MDEKQIFRLYQNKLYQVNWLNENGELAQSEGQVKWVYCGVEKDFKEDVVTQAINNMFTDDEVYLCISPKQSSLVPKSTAVKEIGNILHKKEIGIMDKSCTKIMHFTLYGVFQSGIIRDFPKSRTRPAGLPLKVAFHANIVDNNTRRISDVVYNYFGKLEAELHKDYAGSIEHLWIDLELVDGRTPWPFRFQKRVDNPGAYTELYTYNVAHYSVMPDFEKLKGLLSEEEICNYVFGLLYESTQVLIDKQKKLDGFDATAFRSDFLSVCKKLGIYSL